MSGLSHHKVQNRFSEITRRYLSLLREGKVHVHLPARSELHTRRVNAMFHATPELFIQTGGATDFECPGANFRMQAGEMCVMPRGLPHAETPIDLDTNYSVLVYGMERSCLYALEGLANDKRMIHGGDSLLFEKNTSPLQLIHYLDEIAEYEILPTGDQLAYVGSLLDAFLLRMLHELNRGPEIDAAPNMTLIADARKYIRIHLNESSMTVQGIAASLGCTADHLSRQFKNVEGVKLMTWLAQERVALAKHLLEATRHNVAEVGWASGFNEPSYFIRTFKRYTGMTPRAYRISLNSA